MQKDNQGIENTLLSELEAIERQIVELQSEKRTVERLLTRVRRENVASRDVTRRNSIDRIIVESKILEILGQEDALVSSKHLYEQVRVVDYNLNSSTFRSHLHRMKQRGLIAPANNRRGYWKIAPGKQ